MRNNKAILDEAARSVRRIFIGSVAGSTVMLAVVGAAGAYGMPEKLTAQAFNAAMAKFNVKFAPKAEHVAPAAEQPVKVASAKILAVSSVTDAADEPAAPAAPQAAPVAGAAPVSNPFADRDPAPAVVVSLAPRALPNVSEERPFLATPLVFEIPKPADAQVLTALPKTEVIVVAPQAAEAPMPSPAVEAPKASEKPVIAFAPLPQTCVASEPAPAEFPKAVSIRLPVAKPPLTPAQRLDLIGKDYDKAEKYLAQAIYFEARNEPARG